MVLRPRLPLSKSCREALSRVKKAQTRGNLRREPWGPNVQGIRQTVKRRWPEKKKIKTNVIDWKKLEEFIHTFGLQRDYKSWLESGKIFRNIFRQIIWKIMYQKVAVCVFSISDGLNKWFHKFWNYRVNQQCCPGGNIRRPRGGVSGFFG